MLHRLKEKGIVPDVLDQLPKTVLRVNFENAEVNFGNTLRIKDVKSTPAIIDWDSELDKFYTLCLTDPDAPNRENPVMGERVHWLVGNIPGTSKSPSDGNTLIDYVPSCPGKESGLHRYTFILYEQPEKLDFLDEERIDDSKELWDLRKNFSIRSFAEKYSLGEPFAANFYMAQWDKDAQMTRNNLGLE